jgi:hypothetical protein
MKSSRRDHHTALKTDVIAQESSSNGEFVLTRLQYSKDEIAHSFHVDMSTFSFSGLQRTDLLQLLGFSSESCPYVPRRKCMVTWVPEDFAITEFPDGFESAYSQLGNAERALTKFGLLLPGRSPARFAQGDGHTSPVSKQLKEYEDDIFRFVLSWVEGGGQKGWTYHYYPKHPPLSVELEAALQFLDLGQFGSCPYFEFEPCHWQFIPFRSDDRSISGGNAQVVHDSFVQLPGSFSTGLESLLYVHSRMVRFGFEMLPVNFDPLVPQESIIYISDDDQPTSIPSYEYDVALSFAGPQRELAESLASLVQAAGYRPFYDDFYPEQLWGKDLIVFFDDIYRKKSRFCVIFVSNEYLERMWTNHERRSAQARALEERGQEYILPVRVDDVDLPGMPPTIGYLSIEDQSIDEIAKILVAKLKAD